MIDDTPESLAYVEIYNGTEWVRADPVKLAQDLATITVERDDLARELAMYKARDRDDTWHRQAVKIVGLVKDNGILRDKIRNYEAADRYSETCLSCAKTRIGAEKAEAAVARVKTIADRWRHVPGRRDAARQLAAALDGTTPQDPA